MQKYKREEYSCLENFIEKSYESNPIEIMLSYNKAAYSTASFLSEPDNTIHVFIGSRYDVNFKDFELKNVCGGDIHYFSSEYQIYFEFISLGRSKKALEINFEAWENSWRKRANLFQNQNLIITPTKNRGLLLNVQINNTLFSKTYIDTKNLNSKYVCDFILDVQREKQIPIKFIKRLSD